MSEPDRIAAFAHNTTHVAQGLARLASQFRGKPVLAAILTTWLTQVQELEDALWAVLVDTALGVAVGAQLDQLGEIVGLARQVAGTPPTMLSDAAYRVCLRGWILANRSKGTGEDLLDVFDTVLAGASFTLNEYFPAGLVLEPDAAPSLPASVLVLFLRRTKAAGVLGQLVEIPAGDLFTFGCDPLGEVADAARGWSNTLMTTGGRLVGVVS